MTFYYRHERARVAQSVAHRTYEAVSPELCEGSQFESGRGH